MNRVVLSRQAEDDLVEIGSFIAADNPRAANRWLDLLTQKLEGIASAPEAGRSRDDLARGLRSTPFGNYIVFYRARRRVVQVVRVLHAARDIDSLFD